MRFDLPPATLALLIANVAIFLLMGMGLGDWLLVHAALWPFGTQRLVGYTAAGAPVTIGFHWWQLLTYAFPHGGWAPIGFNMLGHDIASQSAATGVPATASILQMASPATLGLTLLLLAPVSLVMVAFVLTVGIRAKSQREAATALMPGMFVIIILGVFSMAPGIEKMAIIPFVPIINASVAIREMFGQQFNATHYMLALGINAAFALILTSIAAKTLDREDVLFKS